MSFFKRLFSSDYRAALSAEAAGDFELAAERYALAGQREASVRMHLERARRAETRSEEILALRDAVHWAPETGGSRRDARAALGAALLARAKAEGITTARDKTRVREAANLLAGAHRYEQAGEAFLLVGDERAAAAAYRDGGMVDEMEHALAAAHGAATRELEQRNRFADYELHLSGGDRDRALESLRQCLAVSAERADYRRLLDELESRLIASGRVRIRERRGKELTLVSSEEISLGRDALGDMVLRSGGVSRRHAVIATQSAPTRFVLRDAGSRNGTRVGGMPLAGELELRDRGEFQLGDHCKIQYEIEQERLVLSITSGLDTGQRLSAAPEGVSQPLTLLGVDTSLYFRQGRPLLSHPGVQLYLNDTPIAQGDIQLIHGDALLIEGDELEVL